MITPPIRFPSEAQQRLENRQAAQQKEGLRQILNIRCVDWQCNNLQGAIQN